MSLRDVKTVNNTGSINTKRLHPHPLIRIRFVYLLVFVCCINHIGDM